MLADAAVLLSCMSEKCAHLHLHARPLLLLPAMQAIHSSLTSRLTLPLNAMPSHIRLRCQKRLAFLAESHMRLILF